MRAMIFSKSYYKISNTRLVSTTEKSHCPSGSFLKNHKIIKMLNYVEQFWNLNHHTTEKQSKLQHSVMKLVRSTISSWDRKAAAKLTILDTVYTVHKEGSTPNTFSQIQLLNSFCESGKPQAAFPSQTASTGDKCVMYTHFSNYSSSQGQTRRYYCNILAWWSRSKKHPLCWYQMNICVW